MRISDCIHLAVLAVKAKKGKVFLNILGIVIGLSSVIIIMSVGKGGQIAVMSQLDRFGINAVCVKASPGKGGKLTAGDADYLKQTVKGADCVLPIYTNYATIQKEDVQREVMIWGVGMGFEKLFPAQITSGRLFGNAEVTGGERVAVIDVTLAERLFGLPNAEGKKLSLSTNGGTYEFLIKGVVASPSKSFDEAFGDSIPAFIYMPHTTAMNLYGTSTLDYISIKTENNDSLEQTGIRAARVLERKKDEKGLYYAENFARQKDRLADVLNILTFVVGAAAAISLIVGGLGVMNLMLMSVGERTCEIGVMKAIGASGRDIMTQFLFEAVFITLCGGAVGVAFGILVAYVLSALSGLPFAIEANAVGTAIAFSLAMGLVFGVYPAKKAAGLDPIEALRRD